MRNERLTTYEQESSDLQGGDELPTKKFINSGDIKTSTHGPWNSRLISPKVVRWNKASGLELMGAPSMKQEPQIPQGGEDVRRGM